jgi:hypothetical protein
MGFTNKRAVWPWEILSSFQEYFEELALNSALHKTIWLRYVDGTSAVWSHGNEELQEQPIFSVQFTMETES